MSLSDSQENGRSHATCTRRATVGVYGVLRHHEVVLGAAEGEDAFVVSLSADCDDFGNEGGSDKGDCFDIWVIAGCVHD